MDRVEEVYKSAEEFGYDGAATLLGLTKETVRRYCRRWKKENGQNNLKKPDENLLNRLRERFSDSELRRMANGSLVKHDFDTIQHNFTGDTLTVGLITDTHLGSIYTDPDMLFQAFDEFSRRGVDMVAHCGDVHEGLSHRPDHMYQCTHLGYSAQLEHSREVFKEWTDTPIYMIDGNHDRWYIKSNGALIVDELCKGQDNLHFLGHDEGDIDINGIIIKLWHGEDGSSYAYSYRIQKLVESLTGGQKPNVLFAGHTHKAISMQCRHIHCVSAGAIQRQSKWMRSKKHENHNGFHVVKMGIDETGVTWFEPRWYPFYR